jgi:hypothetical protein
LEFSGYWYPIFRVKRVILLYIIKINARTVPQIPLLYNHRGTGVLRGGKNADGPDSIRRIIVIKNPCLINRNGTINLFGVVEVAPAEGMAL